MRRIEIVTGDISQIATQAIVNAANERMLGGGGVDGATSIAFPSISTGVFGYPMRAASAVAVGACNTFLAAHADFGLVVLVAFRDAAAAVLRETFELLRGG